MTFPRTEQPSPALAATGHRADLAQHRAAVGVARRPAAAAQGGRDRRRQLGHRGRGAARPRRARGPARHPHRRAGGARSRDERENERYLPGRRSCPTRSRSSARPRSSSPASTCLPRGPVGGAARRRSARSPTGSARAPRCCCSARAWSRRMGALPAEYVGERVRARAIACARRPGARQARRSPARPRWCSAAADADLRAQLGEVFDRAGLVCERTDDVDRGRDGGRGQERRRARRRGRRAARPQRRRDRRRRGLARVRRLRARARRPSSRPSPASPGSAT